MAEGHWNTVTPDGEEDVTCVGTDTVVHCQVKTDEVPGNRLTANNLTAPERLEDPSSSHLGRLFLDKNLPDFASFSFVSNIGVAAELSPLLVAREATPERVQLEGRLASRLRDIRPGDDRSSTWCVERLTITSGPNSADDLEAVVVRRLGRYASQAAVGLLSEELERLLGRIIAFVGASSRGLMAKVIEAEAFRSWLANEIEIIVSGTEASSSTSAPSLAEKLEGTGLSADEIVGHQAARAVFVRDRRSAVGQRRRELNRLSDVVHAACAELRAARLAGVIPPGAELYYRTVAAVQRIGTDPVWSAKGIDAASAFGSLQDITARCRHRYD